MQRCEVEDVDLGYRAACSSQAWESRIQEAAGHSESVMFTDGSRGEDGRVAGGWSKDSFEAGPWSG